MVADAPRPRAGGEGSIVYVIEERMNFSEKRRGHYLGAEIDEKWWRRYGKDGLLARGIGEFWTDGAALFFRRYLTAAPIVIPLGDVLEVKVGQWHSGRWAGGAPVVKVSPAAAHATD